MLNMMTDEGHLYVCGSNNKGQLGVNTTQDIHNLTRVVLPQQQKVVKATGGWDFTMVLTGTFHVYLMISSSQQNEDKNVFRQ